MVAKTVVCNSRWLVSGNEDGNFFSLFDSWDPNDDDLRKDNINSVEISPQGSCWDPNSTHYLENEEDLVDVSEEVIDSVERELGELFVETVDEE